MSLLSDISWKTKYTPENGNLLTIFYIPALACAVRYDRSTGYFTAGALAAAARGVEGLIRNNGKMRLIVGCTLGEAEVEAIRKGQSLMNTVEASLLRVPLDGSEPALLDALELLAWMVAKGHLEVKVAIPCDGNRHPAATAALFHEKAGIIEDKTGDRLAFNGSINETAQGWRNNWDSFHVFTTWGGSADHVDAEEETFQTLWANQARAALVIDVPYAVKSSLLQFLPKTDSPPKRLVVKEPVSPWEKLKPEPEPEPAPQLPESMVPEPDHNRRKLVWDFIRQASAMPNGGERTGEATCAVTPWPHQIRAFQRMYDHWPPRLLIADEVGLGKTIQTGMLLRQAWMAGKAGRILVLAPAGLLKQWQIELREKFNLNWPIYDGSKLTWYPSPGISGQNVRPVARSDWHKEPFIIASSHLMRRRDRADELLQDAEPWDLMVLDEAHHARRRSGGTGTDDRPNQMLRLMNRLKDRTQGLILLTATPMQVSPVEVWDLLNLLGLPAGWHADAFVKFFEYAAHPLPGNPEMAIMAALFRAIETAYGEVTLEMAQKLAPDNSRIKTKKILKALREQSSIPIRQLEAPERRAAVSLMKAHTPIRYLISRHTREWLRKYHQSGNLQIRIADRMVEDRFVEMSDAERMVYTEMENYISSTYNHASADKRTAIGFVMTIYRKRLASSFSAIYQTLSDRKRGLDKPQEFSEIISDLIQEDLPEDDLSTEIMDADEAAQLAMQVLALEEQNDIDGLITEIRKLPMDTKARILLDVIAELRAGGYGQVMIFTQYSDTLDFLRREVAARFGERSVICFSGRGGEIMEIGGTWKTITREETKKLFRNRKAEIMICTDAAAEGLNFQFCGALINYDMPWNPMKVEQRIGRIDRLGQEFDRIRIVNLHYDDTVETDIYRALRERINLFQTFIGRLQPILARLPGMIANLTLSTPERRDKSRTDVISDIRTEMEDLETAGFNLDDITDDEMIEPDRPEPLLDLKDLGRIISDKTLRPQEVEINPAGSRDFSYLAPGMSHPIRVTTDPDYFDNHPESTELWSPGSPVFPFQPPDPGLSIDESHFFDIKFN